MRTPLACYVLLLLMTTVGPYVLGVRPRSARQWRYVSATVAFLTWLLLGIAALRSA
jgi:hypothetical protein